jgi:hypothetical protein
VAVTSPYPPSRREPVVGYKTAPVDPPSMPVTIELDDELAERMEGHLEEDESYEEFIEELMNIYEGSRFVREGYSE